MCPNRKRDYPKLDKFLSHLISDYLWEPILPYRDNESLDNINYIPENISKNRYKNTKTAPGGPGVTSFSLVAWITQIVRIYPNSFLKVYPILAVYIHIYNINSENFGTI